MKPLFCAFITLVRLKKLAQLAASFHMMPGLRTVVFLAFSSLPLLTQMAEADTSSCRTLFELTQPIYSSIYSRHAYVGELSDEKFKALSQTRDLLQYPHRKSIENRRENLADLQRQLSTPKPPTDSEVKQQWGNQDHIKLVAQNGEQFLSHPDGYLPDGREFRILKKGDIIRLQRIVQYSPEQVQEFLDTGVVTSELLSLVDFDLSEIRKSLQISVEEALRASQYGGFFAIPTAFAKDPEDFLYGKVSDQMTWSGDKIMFRMEFNIPAEALVLLEDHDQNRLAVPEHVRANPYGFAFIQSDYENEITFSDVVPKSWLDPERQKILKKQFSELLSKRPAT